MRWWEEARHQEASEVYETGRLHSLEWYHWDIYLAKQDIENYKPPQRETIEAERHSVKYCRFHEIHEHNTNECCHLRDVIEDLIQKKKL